ncbi:hypothetical protein [Thermofilum pendens]|uniref:Uncharacterized protein n=1 Tax=Thermofilum pendens (strain DSM 2475 / Hrk 5) TaxID=368408 RepID=A1S1A6_THEPD|nr:hypothetical protein [Thermofilum pendens]ABL79236.1 hypothetical protein Tpen_1841 [Thermofilum pendens Hrk 5]
MRPDEAVRTAKAIRLLFALLNTLLLVLLIPSAFRMALGGIELPMMLGSIAGVALSRRYPQVSGIILLINVLALVVSAGVPAIIKPLAPPVSPVNLTKP